jgi:hypothetical protein
MPQKMAACSIILCIYLVDELLQAGYIQTYPSPSLTAHGLYRLTDRGIAATKEVAAEEG